MRTSAVKSCLFPGGEIGIEVEVWLVCAGRILHGAKETMALEDFVREIDDDKLSLNPEE